MLCVMMLFYVDIQQPLYTFFEGCSSAVALSTPVWSLQGASTASSSRRTRLDQDHRHGQAIPRLNSPISGRCNISGAISRIPSTKSGLGLVRVTSIAIFQLQCNEIDKTLVDFTVNRAVRVGTR